MLQLETPGMPLEARDDKVAAFFTRTRKASTRALLLDYDGTLAPFSIDRHRAFPYPGVPDLLDRIRNFTNTRLVIITGRRAYEVAQLLGLKRLEVWGCHGLSRLRTDGTYELPRIDDSIVGRISEANDLLRQQGLLPRVEFKSAATAIHWRGQEGEAEEVARAVERVWSTMPCREGLELVKFDGGMEIRVAGHGKGDAIRTLLSEITSDAAIAYLGDDHTDEDAFAAINGHGLSVLVRNEHRPTMADTWIRPPEGLLAFLNEWEAAFGGAI